MNTIHLIYPFDLSKRKTPWEEGNQIYFALKKNFKFKFYSWLSIEKINPKKGDILFGHSHSNPYTVFRRSMKNNKWSKVILYQPYNEDKYQLSYLHKVLPYCDEFITLCGPYWFKRINKSIFHIWKKKMNHVNCGINRNSYKFLKKKFNEIGKRKILFIGNDYQYNNYAKNIQFLHSISKKFKNNIFGSMGNVKFNNMINYGWMNFDSEYSRKKLLDYDFLIQTSKNDANPSTILEAMSWGLIPIATKQCGYHNEEGIINIPLNRVNDTVKIIKKLLHINPNNLFHIQKINIKALNERYNWKIYRDTIKKIVLSPNKKKRNYNNYYLNKKQKNLFNKYEKNSPNYYLKINMILILIKANISLFIKKIFRISV